MTRFSKFQYSVSGLVKKFECEAEQKGNETMKSGNKSSKKKKQTTLKFQFVSHLFFAAHVTFLNINITNFLWLLFSHFG